MLSREQTRMLQPVSTLMLKSWPKGLIVSDSADYDNAIQKPGMQTRNIDDCNIPCTGNPLEFVVVRTVFPRFTPLANRCFSPGQQGVDRVVIVDVPSTVQGRARWGQDSGLDRIWCLFLVIGLNFE